MWWKLILQFEKTKNRQIITYQGMVNSKKKKQTCSARIGKNFRSYCLCKGFEFYSGWNEKSLVVLSREVPWHDLNLAGLPRVSCGKIVEGWQWWKLWKQLGSCLAPWSINTWTLFWVLNDCLHWHMFHRFSQWDFMWKNNLCKCN